MSSRLKSSAQIWTLASDLGLNPQGDPVREVVQYCKKRIRNIVREHGSCTSLSRLLGVVAATVGTTFEEIRKEPDLGDAKERYLKRGETGFANLEEYLPQDVLGITFKRLRAEPWEYEYVSIIDCRGEKASRVYFTKWHEIAHLLTLTQQRRLIFRRTHVTEHKDPEEALMDVIAGELGFFEDIVKEHTDRDISFEEIQHLRNQLCAEASFQSSVIGFVQVWPNPCILIEARLAHKKQIARQLALQQRFGFSGSPRRSLRAVRVSPNAPARQLGVRIFANMRVPEHSAISKVFREEIDHLEQREDLSWWETSDGFRHDPMTVRVEAKKYDDGVLALVTPL